MKSFLEQYPSAKTEILKAAEVAGYLWQKGWAERNGGNITVNITELVNILYSPPFGRKGESA